MILFILLLSFSALLNPMEGEAFKESLPDNETESSSPRSPLASNSFIFKRKTSGSTESLPPLPKRDLDTPINKHSVDASRGGKNKGKSSGMVRLSSSSGSIKVRAGRVKQPLEKIGDSKQKTSPSPKQKLAALGKSSRKLVATRAGRKKKGSKGSRRNIKKKKSGSKEKTVRNRDSIDKDEFRTFEKYGWIDDVVRQHTARIVRSQIDVFSNPEVAECTISAYETLNFNPLIPYFKDQDELCLLTSSLAGGLFTDCYIKDTGEIIKMLLANREQVTDLHVLLLEDIEQSLKDKMVRRRPHKEK